MATLTVQQSTRFPGLIPAYTAAAGGGDSFLPDSTTYLHIKNGGGSAIEAYINSPVALYGDITVGSVTVNVPAGQERLAGPFPADIFADPSDGLADITWSGVTTVTVGAFRIRQP